MATRINPGIFKRAFFGLLLILSVQLHAQERSTENNSVPNSSEPVCKPCISPFFELLGKGWFSLNVDFRTKETYAISIGAAAIEEGMSPNVMGYYFSGKRHRLEMGGGLSTNFMDGSIYNLFVHGVIGYRYQKKKGLFFRTGFTPMFVIPLTDEGKYALVPLVGISLGYSF
ncbi:MAG: hypothetical protein CVT94_04320 [Bacteroidetes bacterium HGW-Bacteroidetes-11]|jgi:hypothetical protein|nr:MAG: hypothetical protein CVT94_04320 [Bacteroidetes bacterium HGW-Bacteroidetes-11]